MCRTCFRPGKLPTHEELIVADSMSLMLVNEMFKVPVRPWLILSRIRGVLVSVSLCMPTRTGSPLVVLSNRACVLTNAVRLRLL